MFQYAIKCAKQYTLPTILSARREDGTTSSSIGSFIVLNKDGWILTASHIVEKLNQFKAETESHRNHASEVESIKSNHNLTNAQKKKKLRSIKKKKNLVTHFSCWWGRDEWATMEDGHGNRFFDLATARIEDFDSSLVKEYPVFKNPNNEFDVGEMLCKLGFPFYKITPEFVESSNSFVLPREALPIPIFPMEGIFTRELTFTHDDSPVPAKFVETSSPGLMGQSGGPICDTEGRVWAVQVRTDHHPLEIDPEKVRGEHEYFHTGIGTHVETIAAFLNSCDVYFEQEKDQ